MGCRDLWAAVVEQLVSDAVTPLPAVPQPEPGSDRRAIAVQNCHDIQAARSLFARRGGRDLEMLSALAGVDADWLWRVVNTQICFGRTGPRTRRHTGRAPAVRGRRHAA